MKLNKTTSSKTAMDYLPLDHLEEYDSINEQEHVLGEIFCLEKRHIKSTIPSLEENN